MGACLTFLMPFNLTVYLRVKGGLILLSVPDEASVR